MEDGWRDAREGVSREELQFPRSFWFGKARAALLLGLHLKRKVSWLLLNLSDLAGFTPTFESLLVNTMIEA